MLAVAAEASARVPEQWEIEGPGICLSVGDAADLDPDLLRWTLPSGRVYTTTPTVYDL